jgi:hypothetical protein
MMNSSVSGKGTKALKAPPKEKYDLEECKEEIDDGKGVPAMPKKSSFKIKTSKGDASKVNKDDKSGPKENGATTDKKSEKEGAPSGPKGKKNPDFVDMEKTGRWGGVSKLEIIIVSSLVLFILAAVMIAVVVYIGGDDDAGMAAAIEGTSVQSPILTPDAQMALIRSAMEQSELTKNLWDDLGDDQSNPYRLAAAWVVEEDTLDAEADILARFALAAIYYATGGNQWTQTTGWLTQAPICDGWYGVLCNSKGFVTEVELRGNNLTGEIPVALILLPALKVLWLDNNELAGPLASDLFLELPTLEFLYIQNNNLNGPIPDTLLSNGNKLGTYEHV